MIVGYSKNGYYEEAMDMFVLMHRTRVKPGDFTLDSILGVCVSLGVVDQGRELHDHIAKTGFSQMFMWGVLLLQCMQNLGL
jgi:pentatricopeptide repeat protein